MIKIVPLRFERRTSQYIQSFVCGEAGVSEVAACCCLLQDDINVFYFSQIGEFFLKNLVAKRKTKASKV